MSRHLHPSYRRIALATVVLATPVLATACGSDDNAADVASSVASTTTAASTATDSEQTPIVIHAAWARTSPSMATNGAVYFTVTNNGDVDDELIGVSIDPSIATTAEMHNTTMAESGMADSDGADSGMADSDADSGMAGAETSGHGAGGMMTMAPVDSIVVPAGDSVELKPGGYHIMLMGLVEPLVAGDAIEVTLTLSNAGEVVVKAEVRDSAH